MRPGSHDDVHLLGPIEVAAGARFREVGMDDVADDEPIGIDDYRAYVDGGRLWVAELHGAVVGYAMVDLVGGRPHLEQISVVPEAGGRGVGAALMGAVLGWADAMGPVTTLSTFRDLAWNAPWYERFGFEPVAPDALDDALRAVVAHERELGLDVDARVVMQRDRRRSSPEVSPPGPPAPG